MFQVVSILLNKSSFYFNCFPPPSSFSSVLIKYNSTGSHHLILLFDDIRLKSLPYQKQIETKCFYEEKAQICGPLTCFLLMSPAGVGWVWSLCKAHVRPACSGHPEHWLHSPGRAGQKDRRQREKGFHREATICYQSIRRVTVNTFSTTFFSCDLGGHIPETACLCGTMWDPWSLQLCWLC